MNVFIWMVAFGSTIKGKPITYDPLILVGFIFSVVLMYYIRKMKIAWNEALKNLDTTMGDDRN